MSRPLVRRNDCEDCAYSCGLDHRGESFSKVDAGTLNKSADDPSSVVSCEGAVGIHLMLEHPLSGDDTSSWRSRHESPGLVCPQSIELGFHSSVPVRVLDSRSDALRDG